MITHYDSKYPQLPEGETLSPFGPPVWIGKLDKEFIKEANTCIEQRRGDVKYDVGGQLAGRVNDQLTIEDLVSPELKEHILVHTTAWAQSTGMNIQHQDMKIEGLWVNLQKEFEYNPIHAHDGMFSFVFYTKNTISEQDAVNNKFDNNSAQSDVPMDNQAIKKLAGHIELHYGETQFMNWTSLNHYPEKGDILIFPSWLNHSVYPFHDPKGE